MGDAPVNARATLRHVVVGLVVAWAAAWGVNRSLVRVAGPSMLPTLAPGRLVVTLPAIPVLVRPGRVVVARDPRDDRTVVKRVARREGGSVWLAGDNPVASTDSRVFGAIGLDRVDRVVVVALPQWRLRSHGAGATGGGFG